MKAHSTERRVPRKRSLLVSFIFLLALLTAANIIVYLKRNKVDTFVPATYKEIYHPTDVPTLSGTKIIRQGVLKLEIGMREPAGGWIILDDTGDRYEQTGKYPALKLKEFIHNYELETRGLTTPARISVRFGYYSKEFYKKAGRTQPDNYWLISASIPVGKFHQRPLSYWIDTFPYVSEREKGRAVGFSAKRWASPAAKAIAREDRQDLRLSGGSVQAKQAGTPDDRM